MLEDEMLENASVPSNSLSFLFLCRHKASRGANAGVMLFSSGTSPFLLCLYLLGTFLAPKEPGCAEVRTLRGAAGTLFSVTFTFH